MAKDLVILEAPEKVLSLQQPVMWLLGTLEQTKWPGRETIWNFPTGISMPEKDRKAAQQALEATQKALDANNPDRGTCYKARLSILTKALLAFSAGLGPKEEVDAKLDIYLAVVGTFPPWALQDAVRMWASGNAGGLNMGSINYSFMPAPAILCALCERAIQPYREQETRLQQLLSAVSIEEAMNPNQMGLRIVR